MHLFTIIFLTFITLFLIACNGVVESNKNNIVSEKRDTLVEINKDVLTGNLESEWILVAINDDTTNISLKITFNKGEFSQKMVSSTVNGTFKKSENGNLINLKSEKGEDNWEILELNDSLLTVKDLHPENKAVYRFRK